MDEEELEELLPQFKGVGKYGVGYAHEDDWLIADCIKELCGEEF